MFKRTWGYFLLIMLVLTGLAGRLHSDSIPGKERRYLVNDLKITRADLIQSIKGLSSRQYNYRPAKGACSIRDYIYYLASAQDHLWRISKKVLEQRTGIRQKNESGIADKGLPFLKMDRSIEESELLSSKSIHFKNVNQAIELFKNVRDDQLRYVKTTTDNPKHYTVQTTNGYLDIFQVILLTSDYTRKAKDQIEQLKQHPNFPK